jgi:hypothetical protein
MPRPPSTPGAAGSCPQQPCTPGNSTAHNTQRHNRITSCNSNFSCSSSFYLVPRQPSCLVAAGSCPQQPCTPDTPTAQSCDGINTPAPVTSARSAYLVTRQLSILVAAGSCPQQPCNLGKPTTPAYDTVHTAYTDNPPPLGQPAHVVTHATAAMHTKHAPAHDTQCHNSTTSCSSNAIRSSSPYLVQQRPSTLGAAGSCQRQPCTPDTPTAQNSAPQQNMRGSLPSTAGVQSQHTPPTWSAAAVQCLGR